LEALKELIAKEFAGLRESLESRDQQLVLLANRMNAVEHQMVLSSSKLAEINSMLKGDHHGPLLERMLLVENDVKTLKELKREQSAKTWQVTLAIISAIISPILAVGVALIVGHK
jgi:hypothetical protein